VTENDKHSSLIRYGTLKVLKALIPMANIIKLFTSKVTS
jgi:hypothetical protein